MIVVVALRTSTTTTVLPERDSGSTKLGSSATSRTNDLVDELDVIVNENMGLTRYRLLLRFFRAFGTLELMYPYRFGQYW